MRIFHRSGAGALAALAALTSLALANPAAAEASEGQRLGRVVAHDLMSAVDFKAVIATRSGELDHIFDSFTARPEWSGLFKDALVEAIDRDMPLFEKDLGDAFAKNYSIGELKAGAAFLDGAGGRAFLGVISARSRNVPDPEIPAAAKANIAALTRSPDGKAFIEKLGAMDSMMKPVEQQFVVTFLPDTFILFGEKARAAEAARAAADAAGAAVH
jgi:hypothetical protein